MAVALSMLVTLRRFDAGSGVAVARSVSTSTWRLAQDQIRDTQLIAVDEKLVGISQILMSFTKIPKNVASIKCSSLDLERQQKN
ncbi:NADH dehydrogenase [ubiquinone] iron-sulfur protein 4, mitochondrial-like [Larus michahellis]|uniref:NADH dehydrogenase [ubiquinone] iron-sulfur protein 4, mitochondrial-like n=1 Tax=Larus michahellis TaxID=119627 RepID=UPI003D9B0B97